MTVKLKKARGRRAASQRWLTRQLNDPYVKKAKAEGFRSRAAYKLQEMDARFKLLKPGQIVLDLGAAPGGWSQVAVQKVKADEGRGRVIAVDLLEMEPLPHVTFLQMDFLTPDAIAALQKLAGNRVDVVLSDMAPNTVGHQSTDHLRIMAVVEAAADFACAALAPGGHFVAKVFQGGAGAALLGLLKKRFATVKHVKPPASRSESAEVYMVAMGFKAE